MFRSTFVREDESTYSSRHVSGFIGSSDVRSQSFASAGYWTVESLCIPDHQRSSTGLRCGRVFSFVQLPSHPSSPSCPLFFAASDPSFPAQQSPAIRSGTDGAGSTARSLAASDFPAAGVTFFSGGTDAEPAVGSIHRTSTFSLRKRSYRRSMWMRGIFPDGPVVDGN